MTGMLLNVFHDFASSNYTFQEDYATDQDMLYNENYLKSRMINRSDWYKHNNDNTVEGMDHAQIYELCTGSVVNSSVAISCGPYFDQNIMHAIEICYHGNILIFNDFLPGISI